MEGPLEPNMGPSLADVMELGIFLFPTYGNMSGKTVLIRSDVSFLRIRSNIQFCTYDL
jgi:hypothetical protein